MRDIVQALDAIHAAAEHGRTAMGTADVHLHRSIAAAANNRYLQEVYEKYQPAFAASADRLIGMQATGHISDVHDDLVEAIALQDVRTAAAAVRRTYDEIRVRLRMLGRGPGGR